MAQVGTFSQAAGNNWQQNSAGAGAEERHQQRESNQDHRFHIPDDKQEFHIDEYV